MRIKASRVTQSKVSDNLSMVKILTYLVIIIKWIYDDNVKINYLLITLIIALWAYQACLTL